MPLSDAELEQLRKVLYTHLMVLDTLLSSPDRWVLDLHIPVAGQLRVLLCDSEMPVLLTYAKERGIPLPHAARVFNAVLDCPESIVR